MSNEHSHRTGPAARHIRAADDLIAEVVDSLAPPTMSEPARLLMERDDARVEAFLWRLIALCSWGVVIVMLVT